MSSVSVLDDVIDRLIELFGHATGLPAKDGPDDVDLVARELLVVGASLDDDARNIEGDIDGSQRPAYVGDRIIEETGEIPVSIFVRSGDNRARERRRRAIELWKQCEAAWRADLSLDLPALIDSAFSETYRLRYMRTEKGNFAVLTFGVAYRAHLQAHTEGA